ncbi:hypothetical protein, partial [Thiolapillus sp.]|uniref:hypothetical protein n=1 Tax=Thiolapillus sp. TaxID=2017437 RepID=UPI0025DABC18
LESDRLPDWLQRMKYNSEYQYILMLLESVKPRVYGWTLPSRMGELQWFTSQGRISGYIQKLAELL